MNWERIGRWSLIPSSVSSPTCFMKGGEVSPTFCLLWPAFHHFHQSFMMYLRFSLLPVFSRFGPYFVEPVIAGLDPKTMKPFVASLDLIGCPMITEDFVINGTCAEQLYGMCEALWEPDMVGTLHYTTHLNFIHCKLHITSENLAGKHIISVKKNNAHTCCLVSLMLAIHQITYCM